MKSLKTQISSLVIAVACLMMPLQSMAQWSIGASYEIRQEDPQNGFGVRLERSILNPIPIVDVGLRAHFSYFDDDNEFFLPDGDAPVSQDVTYYDFGLAATGGISLGLLKPYIGLGIGTDKYDIEYSDKKFSFMWNSFVGAQFTPIPIIHPFIEYRFQPSDGPDFAKNFNSDGRLILGLSLSF